MSFNGQCQNYNCRAKFLGEIDEERGVGEDVVIIFIAQDTSGIVYTDKKKRPLGNQKRQIIGKEILTLGASQWRRDFVD